MFTVKPEIIKVDWKSFQCLDENGVDRDRILTDHTEQEYTKNGYGFYRSDIASLNHATSVAEYNYILGKMQDYTAQNPDNSKKSVKQMIVEINPRFVQTPAELDIAAEYVGQYAQDLIDKALRQRAEMEAKKAAESAPVEPSVTTT